MLKINLLPPELRKKRKRSRVVVFELTQTFLILIIVFEIALFLSFFLFVNMKVANKQQDLKSVRSELERLQAQVKDVKKLEDDAKKLENRLKIINDLMFSRMQWSKKLNELSNLIPENIWLTSLSLGQQGAVSSGGGVSVTKNVLVLRCKSISYPGEKGINQVGVFMNNLKFSPSFFETFSDVEFLGTTSEKSGETEVINFELRLPFK